MPRGLSWRDSSLTKEEYALLKSLKTPQRIQNFLNTLPFDFADGGKMNRSVRGTLKSKKTDCMGGAVLAAAALWVQGKAPLLLDLTTSKDDYDHVVAVFKVGKCFGAISKTNHSVLRYREPIYKSIRELAMSYFHEYFLPNGRKTMRSFSKPFDLSKQGTKWLTSPESLLDIAELLDDSPHTQVASAGQIKAFRKVDEIEREAGEITEYP